MAEPSEPERCICAAVRLDDGRVFYGHRHVDAMRAARSYGQHGRVTARQQGFVTTAGRYVARAEALMLQEMAGIPSARGGYAKGYLVSEDLY